jgi:predicted aspartyl protease
MSKILRGPARAALCALALGSVGLSSGNATAAPSTTILSQVEARDAFALAHIEEGRSTVDERALAAAVRLSLYHQDDDAARALKKIATSAASDEIRSAAYWEIGRLQLRQGRFKLAAEACDKAMALAPGTDGTDNRQMSELVHALSEVPTMTLTGAPRGVLAVQRDRAHLARSKVLVNALEQEAVLDTGASFSTITESNAKRLGLRILDKKAHIHSFSVGEYLVSLAVADRLDFGGGTLHNVVFLVVPDADLSFAGGAYQIPMILGLPVFMAYGRVEFASGGATERLKLGSDAGTTRIPPNFILDAVQPLALASVEGIDKPLRMFLDTGAQKTHLTSLAIQAVPELANEASRSGVTIGGAGGSFVDADAQSIPTLTFVVGGERVELKDVQVLSRSEKVIQGSIGQDVMGRGQGFILDFDRMVFLLK